VLKEEEIVVITLIGTLITLFISVTLFVFFIYYQQYKFKYTRERQNLQAKQQNLQTEIEIQEHVFKTISQEIHDNIGQLLSLAKLNLHTADIAQPVPTQEKIAQSTELIAKSITALRDLSKSLNAEIIKEIGLRESINRELLLLAKSGQFKTSLVEKGSSYRLDKQKELILFRIFQETINNIIKHSNASTVSVLFTYEPHVFELTISDDGEGFTSDNMSKAINGHGLGIRNMQNRAYLIGAEFKLSSGLGKGTTIALAINNQL
jgi:two-component system, NarL family, sensor kinase